MSINWYVLISQIECIHLNLAHTQKPETFQINKNYFRWFLKSNITQKHLNITKPHYPVSEYSCDDRNQKWPSHDFNDGISFFFFDLVYRDGEGDEFILVTGLKIII